MKNQPEQPSLSNTSTAPTPFRWRASGVAVVVAIALAAAVLWALEAGNSINEPQKDSPLAPTLSLAPQQAQAQTQIQSPPVVWQDPLPDIAAAIRESIVAVGSYHRRDTPTVVYAGTGFVVDDGRLIATNSHVIDAVRRRDRLEDLTVFFPDPDNVREIRGRSATVIAEDAFHDVAILAIEGPPARPLSLKLAIGEDTPRQGQGVAVIGYPIGLRLGLVPAVHRGVISAVVPAVLPLPKGAVMTPQLAAAIRQPYNLYQLDLVVFPGNSGSPLIDARDGRVVGIINKTLANKTREHMLTDPTGISYAVPVRWVHELILRSSLSPKERP